MSSPAGDFAPWLAWLHMSGWAGNVRQPVQVVGETAKRYRIVADTRRVALTGRFLEVGAPAALVPKGAVSERCSFCRGSGQATAVDAVKADGTLVNARPAECMVCDGTGVPIP